MKVLVDGYNIALPRGTGIATYGRGFVHAARALGHETHLVFGEGGVPIGRWAKRASALVDFVNSRFGYHPQSAGELELASARTYTVPAADGIWNRPRLFRAARGFFRRTGRFVPVHLAGVDVAHWTYPLPLYVPGAKNVYTIHDIVPLKHPWMVVGGVDEYRRTCSAIVRLADHILTVSDWSRRDILSEFDVQAERVTNTYQAFDPSESLSELPSRSRSDMIERRGLSHKGYFLFFGAIEPKKNLGRLLDAYEASGVRTPLVIVGAGGWGCSKERERLTALTQLPNSPVHLYGYLSRPDLLELIRHAKATLFPSLYEGFGLPVLESMALGTAVVASNASSLPEVVGEAGLLVDPLSTRSIRDAICAIESDESARVRLEREGLERSSCFSHSAYKQRLASVFEQMG